MWRCSEIYGVYCSYSQVSRTSGCGKLSGGLDFRGNWRAGSAGEGRCSGPDPAVRRQGDVGCEQEDQLPGGGEGRRGVEDEKGENGTQFRANKHWTNTIERTKGG